MGGKKRSYYAVRRGRKPGVYNTWEDCETEVRGYSGAEHKRFAAEADAKAWLQGGVVSVSHVVGKCTVYCDGACRGNGSPNSQSGIGVHWTDADIDDVSEYIGTGRTNNYAELYAIKRAMELACEHSVKLDLVVHTDSRYAITVLNGSHTRARIRAGECVPNIDLLVEIDRITTHLKEENGIAVQYVKVDAHSGNRGNEMADALANAAIGKRV